MATNTIAKHSLIFQSKNLAAAGIAQLRRQLGGLGNQASQTQASMATMASKIKRSIVGLGLIGGAGFGLKLAADAEKSRVAFEVLVGSAGEAKRVMEDLRKFSAETPLQFPELQGAARSLVAFGESTDTVVDTLRTLGDISAGVNAPIGEIATIYGKARVQGRLFAEDINQLSERGIPLVRVLANQFGVTEAAIKKMTSDGQINFSHLEQAFKSMATEGGLFAGLLAAQAETVAGKYSTFKDNVTDLAKAFGETLLPAANKVLEQSLVLIQSLQNLDAATVKNVVVIGAFAGGVVATVAIIPKVIAGIRLFITALRSLASAAILTQSVTGVGLAKVLVSVAAGAVAARAASKAFDKLADTTGEVKESTANAKDAVKSLAANMAAANDRSKGMAANAKKMADESEKAAAAHKSIEESVKRTRQQSLSVGAVTLNSNEGFSATVGGIQRQLQDRSTRNSDRMVDELTELNSQMDQLVDKPVIVVRKVKF